MTTLTFGYYEMPSATLGEPNPMADIKNISYIHATYRTGEHFDKDDCPYLGYGMINTMLPYTQQDDYDRTLTTKKFKCAILENEKLKAVFLTELGGRLWSLFDKVNQKELLYKNNVFQPCNLALRNAWFSGGVEWNVGIKGHNPLTASPLFAAKGISKEGDTVLSLYEYERIRGVVFSVNAVLPDDSDTLYIKVTIENTADSWTPMYWWSNIAVSETPTSRVIAPSDKAILCHYNEGHYDLDKITIPHIENKDVSYSFNHKRTTDYFYTIDKTQDKWIAYVDEDGYGLLQTSEPVLRGRKLFTWGINQGGNNWNEFLSHSENERYAEIQAGLLTTQLEHIPMPPKSTWEWVESYGPIQGDKSKLHSNEWSVCVDEVKEHIPSLISITLNPPQQIVYTGSGWGAYKQKFRAISNLFTFPESTFDSEQADWLELLSTGRISNGNKDIPPQSFNVDDEIGALLEKAATSGEAGWKLYYHLGVYYYAKGRLQEAEEAWKTSVAREENVWALRNLAVLYLKEFAKENEAYEAITKAFALGGNNCRGFLYDYAIILTQTGHFEDYVQTFPQIEKSLQQNGRIRLFLAISYMNLGELDEAAKIVNNDFFMNDVREGELSISHVWFELYAKIVARDLHIPESEAKVRAERLYPLPKHLDFRMD